MKLSRINNFLLIAIILVNGYIIILPVIPGVFFWFQSRDKSHVQQLEAAIQKPTNTPENIPTDNRLIIPSMLLDQTVYDGSNTLTLRKGLWHRPNSSSPDKGGNTVIAGHRFTYTNPRGVLYSLDKVHVGDAIGLWWHGTLYRYTVTVTKITGPNDTSVEAPTTQPELTVYTCTPLWLPHNRLIVVATLDAP